MSEKIRENEIFEYLNASITARGFFISSVEVFEQAIQTLIERVFQKNDFAVQSVVGPLLHDSGPLGELSVRLKLLFGLGVIPHAIYQDIEDIIKLKSLLSNDACEYNFTDMIIVEKIKKLHLSANMGIVSLDPVVAADDDVDLVFYQMQLSRQQQAIKSSLALAILTICEALNKESPF